MTNPDRPAVPFSEADTLQAELQGAQDEAARAMHDPSRLALLARAELLQGEQRAARDAAIRVASDPLAGPVALRRVCWDLAFVNGKLRGWSQVVEAGMQRGDG